MLTIHKKGKGEVSRTYQTSFKFDDYTFERGRDVVSTEFPKGKKTFQKNSHAAPEPRAAWNRMTKNGGLRRLTLSFESEVLHDIRYSALIFVVVDFVGYPIWIWSLRLLCWSLVTVLFAFGSVVALLFKHRLVVNPGERMYRIFLNFKRGDVDR